MGSGQSAFSEKKLKEYQELTFLTKKEIITIYKRFSSIDPEKVHADKDAKLEKEKLMGIPELKVNPFKDRIVCVFSQSNDGNMSFDDFLEMMSVFSDAAAKDVKVEYAFKIYDFDQDNFIGKEDLKEMILRLTGVKRPVTNAPETEITERDLENAEDDDAEAKLSDEDIDKLVDNIMKEADLDEDELLSYSEFEHVISKTPDFMTSFRIRV